MIKKEMLSGLSDQPWLIRATLLDLARQRETLDTIERFIHLIKEWGYNTLVLYLEGLVRTESFPLRAADQSYSPDDMRKIIRVANKAGIDLIPCIPTLAHTDYFLDCKQLKDLGEKTQTPKPPMFCPSNDDVYEFLDRYLCEIADIFPGEHFHIGCDECWALGSCPDCRERLANGETSEDLMIKHILRVRSILQKQGKRIWIWDDMFENASEEKIKELPRDIVMCAWHYWSELLDYGSLPGHFNNSRRRDWLSFYEEAGFETIVCPWANFFENTLALTEIAKQHRVLGGLQTVWELSRAFMPAVFPGVVLAGMLWSQPSYDPQKAVDDTLRKLFPNADPLVRDALRATLIDAVWHQYEPQYFLRGPMTLAESRHLHSLIMYEGLIRPYLERLKNGLEHDMAEERYILLRLQILAGRQRQLLPTLVDPRIKVADRKAQRKLVDWCLEEFKAIADIREKQWSRHRPAICPDTASSHYRKLEKQLASFIYDIENTPSAEQALLNVRLFLWDSFSAPMLKIELNANGKWSQVCHLNFKPVNALSSIYNLQVPVRWQGIDPERIRFTVSGFGGQGISYAELHFANRTLVPASVVSTERYVSNPCALMRDDSTVCFLGNPDTKQTLHQQRGDDASSVEVILAPKKKLSGADST